MGKSAIWSSFKTSSVKDMVVCQICQKQIKSVGGNTSSMWKHSRLHVMPQTPNSPNANTIQIQDENDEHEEINNAVTNTLENYFER